MFEAFGVAPSDLVWVTAEADDTESAVPILAEARWTCVSNIRKYHVRIHMKLVTNCIYPLLLVACTHDVLSRADSSLAEHCSHYHAGPKVVRGGAGTKAPTTPPYEPCIVMSVLLW